MRAFKWVSVYGLVILLGRMYVIPIAPRGSS